VDIISILIQSIQSIAVILIIIGMLIAFMWKVAFYVNFALGLIITILVTYLVNAVGKDVGLTATVFIVGLIGSIIIAVIGGVLCLLEGFILSTLGFWAYWVSGSPSSFLSSSVLLGSAFAGALSTGIAGFLGDRAVSFGIFKGKWSRAKRTQTRLEEGPIEVEIVELDESTKKKIYGYILLYKKFELETVAKRFGLEKKQVENFLLELVADKKIKGSIDPKTETFTLEQETLES